MRQGCFQSDSRPTEPTTPLRQRSPKYGTSRHLAGAGQERHCHVDALGSVGAFDTVDHAILLRCLEVSYGLGGAVLTVELV